MSGKKVVIQKFTSRMQGVWGEALYIERETFDQIGVNLVEVEAENEDEYIESVKDADAILSHGGGIKISKKI